MHLNTSTNSTKNTSNIYIFLNIFSVCFLIFAIFRTFYKNKYIKTSQNINLGLYRYLLHKFNLRFKFYGAMIILTTLT